MMGNRGIRGNFKGNSDFGGRVGSQEAYLLSEGGFYPTFVAATVAGATVNSSETSLLIKSAGTQGDTNTSFEDASDTHTITGAGNASVQSFTPHHPGGYSAYFDGTDDYVTVASSADHTFGSGQFTVEMWVYMTAYDSSGFNSFVYRTDGTNNDWQFDYKSSSRELRFIPYVSGTAETSAAVATATMPLYQWHHIAVTRDGSNDLRLFLNGALLKTSSYSSTIDADADAVLQLGHRHNAPSETRDRFLNGYIRDLRILKGSALYTASFTRPTEALANITNTKLLLCHLPYFRDGSDDNHTVTVSGDVILERFGPYDYVPYSASSHGSSVYFDGTGDYLTVANDATLQPGSSNFTYEAWIYPTSAPNTYNSIFYKRSTGSNYSGVAIAIKSSGVFSILVASGSSSWGIVDESSASYKLNEWQHIAAVRSGSSFKFYVNGVQKISTTISFSVYDMGSSQSIGAGAANGDQPFTGYIADARIVKGSAVYTSAFTPPTAPLSVTDDTKLLACSDQPNIYGAADGQWPITLNGDAQTWTANTKNASNSIYFDGTNDAVYVSHQDSLDLPGNFTVEAWVHPLTLSGNRMFLDTYSSGVSGTWQLYWRSIGTSLAWYDTGTGNVISQDSNASRMSTNQWHHIAATRNNDTLDLWVDGVNVDSDSYTTDLSHSNDLSLGLQKATGTNDFHGYMEDARITKGLSRYPFIPTRTTLTNDANTSLLVAHADSVVDGSSNGHTITGNSPTVSNFAPFGGMKSLQFDGVNDQIIAPAAALDGDADYTIECWYYVESGNYMQFINRRNRKAADGINVSVGTDGTFFLGVGRDDVDAWDLTHTSTKTWNNAWHHFAMTYDASVKRYRVFFDGSQYYTNTVSYHPGSLNSVINIGCSDSMNSGANGYSTGYLSNHRISNFIRYTNSFTPPTTELTA